MPSNAPRRRFDRNIFDAHLIRETEDGTRLSLRLLQREEDELDRATEDEFRVNYQQEYQKACAQAEDKWYPYRAAGIFGEEIMHLYEQSEIDGILEKRRVELRNEIEARYVNGILSEVNKAFERRAMREPTYETEWGFRVKSRGEQAVANALRFYTFTKRNTGECKRVTLLYEPFRSAGK